MERETPPEFSVAYYTDKGAVKPVNQDSIGIKKISLSVGELLYCGLFDGMGGLSYGEQVSGAAAKWMGEWCKSRAEYILRGDTGSIRTELETVLNRISERLAAYGKKQGAEVGTTTVNLLLSSGHFLCCNAGDSRAYHIHGNELTQLSEDHNRAFELAAAGVITPEAARDDPRKNVLTRGLGLSEKVKPAFSVGMYEPGDMFLLCCDGFYHCLEDEEIRTALTYSGEGAEAMSNTLRQLADTAVSRGERDNITAIFVRINAKEKL